MRSTAKRSEIDQADMAEILEAHPRGGQPQNLEREEGGRQMQYPPCSVLVVPPEELSR